MGKFGAFFATGSGSLLAEAVHSAADTLNQCLLVIGIRKSNRHPDAVHPYGYAPERFVWALISATGIFFLGCGVSVYHGITTLIQPSQIQDLWLGWSVLGASAIVEGSTFWVCDG